MQFIPSTWKTYGVDANRDGARDPYNPVDAIFAAARYLRAAGAEKDLRKAIFAYNHADWYVDSVVLRARLIGGLPANFVGSLTGLTQASFPVRATARYADDISEAEATRRVRRGRNAAFLVNADKRRRGINIYARPGSPVVAVGDGRIVRVGRSARLGRFVQLQDVYGNTFTYAHLARVARTFLAPRVRRVSRAAVRRELDLPVPRVPATAGQADASYGGHRRGRGIVARVGSSGAGAARGASRSIWPTSRPLGGRHVGQLAQLPIWPPSRPPGGRGVGQLDPLAQGFTTFSPSTGSGPARRGVTRPLRRGSRVTAGTLLGRIGTTSKTVAPHVLFEIRPAGRGAPRIDPKPILDGWKLLESTAIYRAQGRNALHGQDAKAPSIGQILLASKDALIAARAGTTRGSTSTSAAARTSAPASSTAARSRHSSSSPPPASNPPSPALRCGHGYYTAGGNVSHHARGNAIDIAAINGIPILGHQGAGSITEIAVQRLLTLAGHDAPRPDHHPDDLQEHRQHVTRWATTPTTSTSAGDPSTAPTANSPSRSTPSSNPNSGSSSSTASTTSTTPPSRTKPSKQALKIVKRGSKAHEGE